MSCSYNLCMRLRDASFIHSSYFMIFYIILINFRSGAQTHAHRPCSAQLTNYHRLLFWCCCSMLTMWVKIKIFILCVWYLFLVKENHSMKFLQLLCCSQAASQLDSVSDHHPLICMFIFVQKMKASTTNKPPVTNSTRQNLQKLITAFLLTAYKHKYKWQ